MPNALGARHSTPGTIMYGHDESGPFTGHEPHTERHRSLPGRTITPATPSGTDNVWNNGRSKIDGTHDS